MTKHSVFVLKENSIKIRLYTKQIIILKISVKIEGRSKITLEIKLCLLDDKFMITIVHYILFELSFLSNHTKWNLLGH